MEEDSNVNPQRVRGGLEEGLLAGRTPVEAVGELRWSTRASQRAGFYSRKSRDGILQIGNEWLGEKVGSQAAAQVALAEMYARFLAERVRPGAPAALHLLEEARRKWRSGRGT